MKYVFRHTAIIEHEVDAATIKEAREKFDEEVLSQEGFFEKASTIVTDERIMILNEKGDHIDTYNVYDM